MCEAGGGGGGGVALQWEFAGVSAQLTRISRNTSSAHVRTLHTPTPDVLEVW